MYPATTSAPVTETTRQAQEDAVLSPRFYTTDFDELDAIDLGPVRERFEELMREFRDDPNKRHFRRTEEFEGDWSGIPHLDQFVDFLVSSITAEFSGCILYAEIRKRVTNPDIRELFGFMSRDEGRHAGFINSTLNDLDLGVDLSFLTRKKHYTHFKPKFIYYATYLSEKIGYARYITIYRRLQENRQGRIHPIFDWFEDWCNDEFRHGEVFAMLMHADPRLISGRNKLWIRFFLLAVYATMYVRDHLRSEFYAELGFDVTEYDFEVFRKTNAIARQVFPVELDIDNPRFRALLDRMYRNTARMRELSSQGAGKARLAPLAMANAATFARLYAIPARKTTPPADFRLQPAY